MALSGHFSVALECPLSGVKRISRLDGVNSAHDPKRTYVKYTDFKKEAASEAAQSEKRFQKFNRSHGAFPNIHRFGPGDRASQVAMS